MPIEHAVLWQPVAAPNESPDPGAYPVFITRRALEALNHYAFPSGKAGVFGFIVGDLCHCPRTGILYVAVDGLIGLPQPVYGDKTGAVTANVWPNLQQQLVKLKRHLLGWYHSHPPMGVTMTPGDVEAHFAYFPQPWQVALVVGLGEHGPEAGFFRPIAGAAAPDVPLHFFEILDPRVLTADGRRRSFVHWKNYEVRRRAEVHITPKSTPAHPPHVASLPASTPSAAPSPAAPAPPDPDALTPELPEVAAVRVPRVPPPRRWDEPPTGRPPRARRAVRLPILIGVAAAGALVLLGRAVLGLRATPEAAVPAPAAAARLESVPPAPAPVTAPAAETGPPVAPALSAFAAASDSLAADLRDYQSRATRFAGRRTDCPGLGGAFATLEQRWITYSIQRRKLAGQLDLARAAADSVFYSAMDSVESGFERSGCPRP
jgi:hypothetical protein